MPIFLIFINSKRELILVANNHDFIIPTKGETQMSKSNLSIVPQQFSFEKPTLTNGKGEVISHGINVSISIDAFQADKIQLKKDLAAIFAEVLEYFD